MNVETRNVSVSFDQPDRVLSTLRTVLQQTLDSPPAWAAGILPLRNWHRVVIVDTMAKRAEYIAQVVTAAGYSPLVTTSVVDAYTQFLQESFLPIVIIFGQEQPSNGLFLLRLQKHVAQKYHWNIPLLRLIAQPVDRSVVPVSRPAVTQPLMLPQPTRHIQPTWSVQPASRASRTSNRFPLALPMPRQNTPSPGRTGPMPSLQQPGPAMEPARDIRPGKTGPMPTPRSVAMPSSLIHMPLSPTLSPVPSSPLSPPSPSVMPGRLATQVGIAVHGTSVEARLSAPTKEVAKQSLEGQNIGRYQILTLLGGSPLSDVYRVYDRLRETHVALKAIQHNALPDGFLNDDYTDTNLFQQEVDTLAKLKHPHIFRILSAGKSYTSGTPFYYKTMTHSEEGSLAAWRFEHGNSRPFAPKAVLPIAVQIADALQCAHDQQILYQNFKLTNLLLQDEAKEDMRRLHVLLVDFALIGEDRRVLRTFDTLPYLAPEQWQNEALPASDQYGLAAILYELLTGRPPFSGQQEHLLRHMHLHMQPQAPSVFNLVVSAAMDKVILRALAKNPHDRFATVSEFARALREAGS
ncbi:MAG: hypothetical protein E6I93_09705 [Chloroflexi bacterium]|nr:MAG: hypothetical protein E6I93_09705 [Chloroflexota bacterium]